MSRLPGLLAALLLAGCVAPTAAPPRGDEAPPRGLLMDGRVAPTSFVLEDCEAMAVAVPLPLDEFRAIAPPGFDPAPFDLPTAGQFGRKSASAHRCTFAGEEVLDLLVNIDVVPPPEFEADDINVYAIAHADVRSHSGVADVLRAWGSRARQGEVRLDLTRTAAGAVGAAEASAEGVDVRLDAVAAGPPASLAVFKVRFFVVEDRAVVAIYHLTIGGFDLLNRGHGTIRDGGATSAGVVFHPLDPYAYLYEFHARGAGP